MLSRSPSNGRLLALASALAIFRADAAPGDPWELGPFWHEYDLTWEPGHRTDWLGPLFSQESTANGSEHLAILPPLLAREANQSLELKRYDIAYPLLTWSRFGTEYRWQLFQLIAFSGGHTPGDDESKKRTTFFPVYFHQSSSNPSNRYTAVLPIYGTMRNHLFRDEVHFVLLPLYVRTKKSGMITDNYLAPFFHRRHGAGYDGWQFLPVIGRESKAVTYKTNNLDEAEVIPGHEKFFAAWPFIHRQTLGIGTPSPQTNTVVFPLFAWQRSPLRDQSQYLIPFFTFIDDREKKYREVGFPWPFVDFARGEGKTANRIWPLFSRARTPSAQSEFYAWPLWMHRGFHGEEYERERSRVLFFLWSDTVERNLAARTERRRRDLWPLFTHKHDFDGRERLQILAPLEPFVPNNRGIERGWSPVWSLYRDERNPKAGTRSQSFLWNLWRRDVGTNQTKTSFLFGAIKTEKGADGRRWGLFKIRPRAPAAPPPDTGAH